MKIAFNKVYLKTLILISFFSFSSCQDNEEFSDILNQFNAEIEIIDQYIANNNLTAFVHPSGLRIVFIEAFDNERPVIGQRVRINYTGYLLDGTVFDTTIREVAVNNNILDADKDYQPIEFVIGNSTQIQALETGVTVLGEEDVGTILSPSGLAYGNSGFGGIVPPDTPVAFDVTLLEIIQ